MRRRYFACGPRDGAGGNASVLVLANTGMDMGGASGDRCRDGDSPVTSPEVRQSGVFNTTTGNPPVAPSPLVWLARTAVALHREGRRAEARDCYRRALAIAPQEAGLLEGLGICAGQDGDAATAVLLMERAWRVAPAADLQGNLATAWRQLGRTRLVQGAPAAALEALARALALASHDAVAWELLAHVREALNEPAAAVAALRRTLALAVSVPVYGNLSRMLDRVGDRTAALLAGRRASILAPDLAEAAANLSQIWLALECGAEAEACQKRALALKPELFDVYVDLARSRYALGRIDAGLTACDHALALVPGHDKALWNRALLRLLSGDYARAWPDFEARQTVLPGSFQPCPPWRGEDPAGLTLLVWQEQGFGDLIQSARFLAPLARRGARVVLGCREPVAALMRQIAGPFAPGSLDVVAQGEVLPPCDAHVAIMSLPGRLGLPIDGTAVPYLIPDKAAVAAWRQRLARPPRPAVGLAWAGNPAYSRDASRSIPFPRLAPLLDMAGVDWISLQFAHGRDGLPEGGDARLRDVTSEMEAFTGMAAAIAALDLVVTVDTAVAHLAGAMGVPVWLALSASPHWVWQIHRDDSPWYPTARLFRQSAPGDWDGVMARMVAALGEWIGNPRGDASGDRLSRGGSHPEAVFILESVG
jgi:tetratricopeptide (TPR) repeat protein